MADPIPSIEPYRRAARAAAIVSLLVGAAALSGWIADVDVLKSIVPGHVTMKVNTAVCFLAMGAALWMTIARPRRAPPLTARLVARSVAVLAAAVLSQYVTGWDLGIDQLLFEEPAGAVGTWHANRMAPNTAVGFILLGGALGWPAGRADRPGPVAIAAGVVAALALLALFGYASSVRTLYGLEGVTQMAVPTAFTFVCLAAAIPLARPEWGLVQRIARDSPGAAMLRSVIPALAGLPLVLGALRLIGHEAGLYEPHVGSWLVVAVGVAGAVAMAVRLARLLDEADARRRELEVMRNREERTRAVVETAHDAFISMDAGGRIRGWNGAAELILGWAPAEVMGRDLARTLIPARLRGEHARGVRRALDRDVTPAGLRAVETFALHRDGSEVPVEISVASTRENGEWVFNAFLRDISERLRARAQLQAAQLEVIERLAHAAEYRDDDTGEHTQRVGELSGRLAARAGLSEDEVELIRHAAPLHDVGKIGIPDAILLKPGRLTSDEFELMKDHAEIGAEMLSGRGFPLLEIAEVIARTHHERWDGSGYPRGLAGHEIPVAGRIVAIADVFDALIHDRPYKMAWTVEDALTEIATQSGRQFDPALVDAFLALVRCDGHEPPTGATASDARCPADPTRRLDPPGRAAPGPPAAMRVR